MTHDINIHHVTRVEGHGNIVLNVNKGRIEELRLEIVESPRFFEVMLKGRRFDEAPHITSRICGICAISHASASIKACEMALGITPSKGALLLRKILMNAEILQSHILHVYLLAAPDFFGLGSVIPMAKSKPDIVKRALRLKSVANKICECIVGRHIHPIGMSIGGFNKLPNARVLGEVRGLLEGAIADLDETVNFFMELEMPELNRETTYVSLKNEEEYALYDGYIHTKDHTPVDALDYKDLITEEVIEYSTAKHAKTNDKSIMVGALARLNNNYDDLSDEAKEAAKKLGMRFPCTNPFMNNIAQVVESTHCVYDSLRLLDTISREGLDGDVPEIKVRAGRGVGIVEAPRGTLYHDYEIDDKGIMHTVNCIIPTGQNLANIEMDIEAMVPLIINLPKKEIELRLEMLVRAYDPCISCSTHFLKVKFVD